jgi:hypothetical protein
VRLYDATENALPQRSHRRTTQAAHLLGLRGIAALRLPGAFCPWSFNQLRFSGLRDLRSPV